MEYIKEVIIKKVDLDKLLNKKGLTLYMLAKKSMVDYSYLSRANKGDVVLSTDAYNKIKKY